MCVKWARLPDGRTQKRSAGCGCVCGCALFRREFETMSFIRHHQTKENREKHHHHHLYILLPPTSLHNLIRSIIDPAKQEIKIKVVLIFPIPESSERKCSAERRINLSFPRRRDPPTVNMKMSCVKLDPLGVAV